MSYRTSNLQNVSGWLGRLLRLDLSAFDEIRSDPSATLGAIAVVFGASLLAGVGSWLWAVQTDGVDASEVLVKSLVVGSVLQTLGWFFWVYFAYMVLARGYGARTEFASLVRTMGFAFAPSAVSVLVAITAFAVPFGVTALAATVLLTHFAIQASSSADPRQSFVANIVGFLLFAVVMGALSNLFEVTNVGGLAPGLFFFSLDLR